MSPEFWLNIKAFFADITLKSWFLFKRLAFMIFNEFFELSYWFYFGRISRAFRNLRAITHRSLSGLPFGYFIRFSSLLFYPLQFNLVFSLYLKRFSSLNWRFYSPVPSRLTHANVPIRNFGGNFSPITCAMLLN